MIHDELESLVRRINDKRVPVETTHNDGIFDAQIIIWKLFLLPHNSVLRLGKELSVRQRRTELQGDFVDVVYPVSLQDLSIVVVEETNIGKHGGR